MPKLMVHGKAARNSLARGVARLAAAVYSLARSCACVGAPSIASASRASPACKFLISPSLCLCLPCCTDMASLASAGSKTA